MPTPATPRRLTRRGALATAVAASLATLAACAGAPASPATPTATASAPGAATASGFPVTVTVGGSTVTLDEQPTRIVSLSPTATETLFAIDADAQVVAVDDQSSYPAEAPRTELSGFQPNAEAVAGYTPDLVVASGDANGLVDSLTALDIPVLVLPAAATLDDAYEQIDALGQATGRVAEASAVSRQTKDRIAAAVASVPQGAQGLKVYHELDPSFYSVTSDTFLGSIYTAFGLTNIADGATDLSGGYPQLSAEFVVTQAPDLIVLADTKCCQQSAASVAERPGFADVPAVVNGRIVEADDDIASRWGPRTADFAEAVANELAAG